MELTGKIPIPSFFSELFFLFLFPCLIPCLERRFQKWKPFLFSKKVDHSQLALAGAKGELVAGCGGQQAGGDFGGTGF